MGLRGHRHPVGKSDEWLTPPYILEALGKFDLDPCTSHPRPWDTARVHYTEKDDGLTQDWFGRVWVNPPYGPPKEIRPWIARLAEHGRGTALIFARTETRMFQDLVFARAAGVLFLRGRLRFYRKTGLIGEGRNAGAPSALVAYGDRDALRLERSGLPGRYIDLN